MNDVTTTETVDTDVTEVKFTITPKQKLIAKIVGATTVAAGIFAVAYRLGSDDLDNDSDDVDVEVTDANDA